MWTKVKARMYNWIRNRNKKIINWRMTTIYNHVSEVMLLYSISCSDCHQCELKLKLECIVDLGVGIVKSFFREWPLFIILRPESCYYIPFLVQIMWTKFKGRMSTCLRSRNTKVFFWRMTTFYNAAFHFLFTLAYIAMLEP